MKKILTIASGLLLLTLAFAWWMSSRGPKPVELIPTLTGQPEYCITCHADVPDISPSHPTVTFGCVTCHGGERLALDADLAHSTMRGGANPSDLSVVEASCGGSNCHSGSEADDRNHIQRVMTSVQSTYAGAIANIRYTFGAQTDLNAHYGISAVTDDKSKTGITSLPPFNPASEQNPSLQKFGEECLTCHLRAEPREGDAYARQTGCAACHSPLFNSPPIFGENGGSQRGVHTLTTAISYAQCNTCHNRGNYDLRSMTFVERDDHPTQRIDDYYQPIAQFTQCEYTLDCVDCHTRDEAMGDGDIHANQKSIEYVQCKTCHGTPTELPLTKTLTDPNDIAFRLAFLNPVVDLQLGDTIIVTEKGEPLWNTKVLRDGTYEMIGKATNQYFTFKPVMGSHCTQSGEDQSSSYCHECHAVERQP
ncbi:MAG: hypothetical protein KDD72_05995 [Anaerolineales bacterium]|nr:hypothetical protein [Anaerolineales bacterium]